MKVFLVLAVTALLCAGLSALAVPPTVSSVAATQRTDGSKMVDIVYAISDPDSVIVGVLLKISTDGGTTYSFTPVSVTGDVGEGVAVTPQPAQNTIVWNAGNDMPYTFGQNFRAAVTAHDCAGYSGEMITIPAGPFQMGNRGDEGYSNPDELPQHEVTLSAYEIGKYEVTRGEYRRFITAGGYQNPAYWSTEGWAWRAANTRTQPDAWAADQTWEACPYYCNPTTFVQTDRHPVVGVTYYEAEAFCNWVGGHLPTEAQWEKAARWVAATSTPRVYPWGDLWDASRLNCLSDLLYAGAQTAPVGSYLSPSGDSPYGCRDMAGNVWEWCRDWYQSDYYSQSSGSDPAGPTTGTVRAIRGGAWGQRSLNNSGWDDPNWQRGARRTYNVPTESALWEHNYGFRVAR